MSSTNSSTAAWRSTAGSLRNSNYQSDRKPRPLQPARLKHGDNRQRAAGSRDFGRDPWRPRSRQQARLTKRLACSHLGRGVTALSSAGKHDGLFWREHCRASARQWSLYSGAGRRAGRLFFPSDDRKWPIRDSQGRRSRTHCRHSQERIHRRKLPLRDLELTPMVRCRGTFHRARQTSRRPRNEGAGQCQAPEPFTDDVGH